MWSGLSSLNSATLGQTVVIEKRGPVLTVGINRPKVRNAVNQETARQLFEEFSAFNQDDTLSVAVLHGIGQWCSLKISKHCCLYSQLLLFCVFLFSILFVYCLFFFSGGNFCAGYDLKELSQDSVSLTLKQNVTQGPAPMVRG